MCELIPDIVEQVLHVDPALVARSGIVLLESLHVWHCAIAEDEVGTALDDVARALLGSFKFLF